MCRQGHIQAINSRHPSYSEKPGSDRDIYDLEYNSAGYQYRVQSAVSIIQKTDRIGSKQKKTKEEEVDSRYSKYTSKDTSKGKQCSDSVAIASTWCAASGDFWSKGG